MYLLDTNVISELRKASAGKANTNLLAWANTINADELYISVISLMELEIGIKSLERKDTHQGLLLRSWLEQQVMPEFSARTLVIDAAVALRCARLHVPNKRSERDAFIAAIALTHAMPVVTRNTKDFQHTGVQLINPWEFKS